MRYEKSGKAAGKVNKVLNIVLVGSCVPHNMSPSPQVITSPGGHLPVTWLSIVSYAGGLVGLKSPPSMKQGRHALATLLYKGLLGQTVELHCTMSKQSRHAPLNGTSGPAPSALHPPSLAALQDCKICDLTPRR